MSEEGIICVLNVYNRPQWFDEQLTAIQNQTLKPKLIIVWNNNNSININDKVKDISNVLVLSSSRNLGVWARFFSLYYLFKCKYICVFDDDTIPQKRWFENCVETIKKHNALLGTIGIAFKQGKGYQAEFKYGWEGLHLDEPSSVKNTNYVDIVGHSWFLKEWISTLIKDLPNIDEEMFVCGEDMHLSYVLQKYLYIPTMVPPHPLDNRELWGAIPEKSKHYGNVDSTYSRFSGDGRFQKALSKYIDRGYETIMNRYNNIKVWNNCLDYFINKIKNNKNIFLLRFADGELYVLNNKRLTNCDNWTFKENGILCKHLNEALTLENTNVYYGISCLSDHPQLNYYYNKIFNHHNITYANVFVNNHYKKWKDF